MRQIVSSVFLLLMVLVNTSLAQVIIRERIEIKPVARPSEIAMSSSASYLSPPTFLTPAVGVPQVALPSNITVDGTINFTPAQLAPRQWVLLRLTGVGPEAVELHYIEKTISGQLIERKNTFSGPVGICGGGSPHMLTFDGSVGGASLLFNNSGNQVTYTLTGGLRQGPNSFKVPVTATATSSASAQPGFALAQWSIGSSQDSLIGGETGTVTITALNASGEQYSVCTTSNADATVTVSIQAQGEYAFLRGPDGQEGSTITIPFLSGTGFSAVKTCYVVVDESLAPIPGGRDVATITVSGGPTATKQILLKRALDHFRVEVDPQTVDFGFRSYLFVTAENQYGEETSLADETMLKLTIDQSKHGKFVDTLGNEYDTLDVSYYDAYVGNVQFIAKGTNPDEPTVVNITCAALIDGVQTTGEGQVIVMPFVPECAVIEFDPQELAPGDTASLSFFKLVDEVKEPFPGGKLFDVRLFGDKGTLLSSDGTTGKVLKAVAEPVYYIAPDSIEGDSIAVQMTAETSPPTGGAPPIIASVAMASGGGEESIQADPSDLKVCTIGEVTVKKPLIPTKIELRTSSDAIQHSETITLKVTLKDKDAKAIPVDDGLWGINFFLGAEGVQFGNLNNTSTGADAVTLNDITYKQASDGSITFVADGATYDGRFPLGISVGASVAVNGNVYTDVKGIYLRGPHTLGILFLQANSSWADSLYDSDTTKISKKGCALSCMAMVLKAYGVDVNPGALNAWMKEHNGYKGKSVKWATIDEYDGSPVRDGEQVGEGLIIDDQNRVLIDKSTPRSLSELDPLLTQNIPIIAQVYNSDTGNTHWVVVTGRTTTGDYTILDPGGKINRVMLSGSYKNIYKFVPVLSK